MISILVAFDEKRLIGKNGKLPWHIKEDLQLFKERTLGNSIIMGRKTWDSFPKKPLPGRLNIVLSKTFEGGIFNNEKVYAVRSLEEGVFLAKAMMKQKDIFIIGGAEVYKEALNKKIVDKIIVSKIKGSYEGDVYFPEFDKLWVANLVSTYDQFDVWEYIKE